MPTHKTEKVLRISEFNLTKTNIITDVHIFVQNNHPHQPNGSCEQYINLAFDNQVHTIEFSRTRHPPYTTHHRPSEKLIFNLTGSSALPNNVSQELRGSPSYNKRRAETTRRPWRFSPADPLSAFLPTRVNYRTDPPPPANATTTRACRDMEPDHRRHRPSTLISRKSLITSLVPPHRAEPDKSWVFVATPGAGLVVAPVTLFVSPTSIKLEG